MIKIIKLINGITCVVNEHPGSGQVSMQVRIAHGALSEADNESGLTYLTQEAMSVGTKTRSHDVISEDIDSKGAGFSSTASRKETLFNVKCRAQDAGHFLDVMADIIHNPSFEMGEVERIKKHIAKKIEDVYEDPASHAHVKFQEMALGRRGGRRVLGDTASVQNYTLAQLQKKHAELISSPDKIILSFSGDITKQEAEKLAERYFGGMRPLAVAKNKPAVLSFSGGDFRKSESSEQLNIKFGFEMAPEDNLDAVGIMLQEVLSGGMSSPLFQEIREKRGLVYSVYAAYEGHDKTGIFSISAATSKGNAKELMDVAFSLLGDMARNGITQEMLDKSRAKVLRNWIALQESDAALCNSNAMQMQLHGHIMSVEEIGDKLKRVSPVDIRRALGAMLLSEKYALSAVGPQDGLQNPQEISALMQKHSQGLVLPPKQKTAPIIRPEFNSASRKMKSNAVDPKITVLPNGLTVVTLERPGTLSCGAWVGAGSDHETEELNGAGHMNEHMMFKGTPSYGSGMIDRIVEEEFSGKLNAYTSQDKTAYYFYNLEAGALEKVTDICSEMVFHANLDHDEFNGKNGAKGERDVVIEEIRMYADDPSDRNANALMAVAYPNQSHGRPILGTEKTISAMTVGQLAAYRDLYYAPNNVVFSAVGPICHEDFVAIVEKKCGHLQPKNFSPLPVPVYQGGTVSMNTPETRLSEVTVAAPAATALESGEAAYDALGIILGGGDSSRLHRETVLNQKLTTDIGVGNASQMNVGMFFFSAKVEPAQIKPLISTIYSTLRKAANDITPAEVEKAKINMEMSLLASMETNSRACNSQACSVLQHKRVILLQEKLDNIRKLSVDDVRKAAQKILEANPTVAVSIAKGMASNLVPSHQEVLALRDGKVPPLRTPKPPSLAA